MLMGLLAVLWAGNVWAQDEEYEDESYENVGFFNFVNALSSKGALMIEVAGSKVGENGLSTGQESGALGLDAGSYAVKIECEGYVRKKSQITVKAKKAKVYFFYDIIEKKEGEVIKKIGVKTLEPEEVKGKFPLSIYSLIPGDTPTLLQLGTTKTMGVLFGKSYPIPGWNGKEISVSHNKRKVMEIEAEDMAGYHHVIVPYLDGDGKVVATVTVLRDHSADD
jgi:hypothetical protein